MLINGYDVNDGGNVNECSYNWHGINDNGIVFLATIDAIITVIIIIIIIIVDVIIIVIMLAS